MTTWKVRLSASYEIEADDLEAAWEAADLMVERAEVPHSMYVVVVHELGDTDGRP